MSESSALALATTGMWCLTQIVCVYLLSQSLPPILQLIERWRRDNRKNEHGC